MNVRSLLFIWLSSLTLQACGGFTSSSPDLPPAEVESNRPGENTSRAEVPAPQEKTAEATPSSAPEKRIEEVDAEESRLPKVGGRIEADAFPVLPSSPDRTSPAEAPSGTDAKDSQELKRIANIKNKQISITSLAKIFSQSSGGSGEDPMCSQLLNVRNDPLYSGWVPVELTGFEAVTATNLRTYQRVLECFIRFPSLIAESNTSEDPTPEKSTPVKKGKTQARKLEPSSQRLAIHISDVAQQAIAKAQNPRELWFAFHLGKRIADRHKSVRVQAPKWESLLLNAILEIDSKGQPAISSLAREFIIDSGETHPIIQALNEVPEDQKESIVVRFSRSVSRTQDLVVKDHEARVLQQMVAICSPFRWKSESRSALKRALLMLPESSKNVYIWGDAFYLATADLPLSDSELVSAARTLRAFPKMSGMSAGILAHVLLEDPNALKSPVREVLMDALSMGTLAARQRTQHYQIWISGLSPAALDRETALAHIPVDGSGYQSLLDRVGKSGGELNPFIKEQLRANTNTSQRFADYIQAMSGFVGSSWSKSLAFVKLKKMTESLLNPQLDPKEKSKLLENESVAVKAQLMEMAATLRSLPIQSKIPEASVKPWNRLVFEIYYLRNQGKVDDQLTELLVDLNDAADELKLMITSQRDRDPYNAATLAAHSAIATNVALGLLGDAKLNRTQFNKIAAQILDRRAMKPAYGFFYLAHLTARMSLFDPGLAAFFASVAPTETAASVVGDILGIEPNGTRAWYKGNAAQLGELGYGLANVR